MSDQETFTPTPLTPTPWEIDWYVCREAEKILWRVARSIGPIVPDHNHWGGWFVCNEIDAIFARHVINNFVPMRDALELMREWVASERDQSCGDEAQDIWAQVEQRLDAIARGVKP
ncbi:hypothetical protein LCGC14_2259170 [marine sediment metagenome]|uniref:Uncharacterized protein n=1 Tax=marine sediment metagenome TaxID=412755 RepID=A0A0F9FV82_9ZZZZ